MADPLIKSVNHTPRVPDALKKSDSQSRKKSPQQQQKRQKKDSKRIIDTYA
jgi:hypothetical protein